ncbi:MAG TPA: ferredoxin [Chitinophagales bacterium]|nr:ferredoxin [Chitinophagales bacterium]
MPKYKIEFDANTCIGSMNCLSVAGDIFGEDENNFTVLKNARLNESSGKWELIIGEDLVERAREAESHCPSLSITVSEIPD